jgi:hypothetical protein
MIDLTTTSASGAPRIRALIEGWPEGTGPSPEADDDLFMQPARLLARRLQRGDLMAVEALTGAWEEWVLLCAL